MKRRLYLFFTVLLITAFVNIKANAQDVCDRICGRWQSIDKHLVVDVYKENGDYKAKLVWFVAGSDKLMHECADDNNPDITLRTRKVLGMNILRQLKYVPKSNSWENGLVYDASHGREWNAACNIDKNGLLQLKGYWHFKFIGKTMAFERADENLAMAK
jgi:uncharacterized protein (DUF2147 family)